MTTLCELLPTHRSKFENGKCLQGILLLRALIRMSNNYVVSAQHRQYSGINVEE